MADYDSDPFDDVDGPGGPEERAGGGVLIDCDTCQVRDIACGDCVMSVFLGTPEVGAPGTGDRPPYARLLRADERAAIQVLADHGLVPPLRLASQGSPRPDDAEPSTSHAV